MSVTSRALSLERLVVESGVDALLTTTGFDLRWLTGFTGSSGLAITGPESRLFVTDFRYVEQSQEQVDPAYERAICDRKLWDPLPDWLGERRISLGFDPKALTVAQLEDLTKSLPESVELIPVEGLIGSLREVKDPTEIELIAKAAEIADGAFSQVVGAGLEGHTEIEIAWALEVAMRESGAEGLSFPPIVAAGAHGALPHAEPRDRPICRGEMVTIDWGAIFEGYCSDCTRTVAVGSVGEREREIHSIVLAAEQAGVASVRPGLTGAEIDAVSRAMISEAGYGERFGHGLGHGVGLEVHEGPTLGRTGDRSLAESMVVTVEPGIYLPGECGVRIEDLVVVDSAGARVLTHLPRELIEVD